MPETLQIDGLAVVADVPPAATRPPILFVHGMAGGAWYFDRFQRFFAERGWPTYALDLRGHCGSGTVPDLGRVSMRDYADDALAVLRALPPAADGGAPVVVGHSMGGLVAQLVAERGAARALVLLNAAPPRGIPVFSTQLLVRQTKHLPKLLLSRPLVGTRDDHDALTFNRIPEGERDALFARLVPESGRAGREMSFGLVPVDAGKVRCPVLSVASSDDRFLAPRIGRALARKYGATLLEFPGHGHFIVYEPGWERPAADVERWVRHVVEREARAEETAALERTLADATGGSVALRYFDDRVLAGQIRQVASSRPGGARVHLRVERVLAPGSPGRPPIAPGAEAVTPTYEVAEVRNG